MMIYEEWCLIESRNSTNSGKTVLAYTRIREFAFVYDDSPDPYTVELQWLVHLWDPDNLFETGVVRANEG